MEPRRLLIVSSVRWGYLWQRHQALALAAAENGWLVDFLEPHPRNARQIVHFGLAKARRRGPTSADHGVTHPNLRVLGPSTWLRPPSGQYDLAIVYLPDRLSERLLRRVGASAVIYDAVLDWATVPAAWYPPIGWRASERRIGRAATTTTTDAPGMQRVLATRGIDATVVYPAADDAFLAASTATLTRRTAVYFGSVRDETDVSVLAATAAAGIRTDVIGTVDAANAAAALDAAGVRTLPQVSVAELARLVAGYEFVLLPYRGERAATLVPAKLWNALASGRWVIASGLSLDLDEPNLIALPADAAKVVEAIEERTGRGEPPAPARLPTWHERWSAMLGAAGLDA